MEVTRDGDRRAFAAPPLRRSGPVDEELRQQVLADFSLDPDDVIEMAWIDNGPGWIGVLLGSAEAVLAVEPGDTDLDVGLIGMHRPGSPAAYEVRAFFRGSSGVVEDPVTGSLNASAAQWLIGNGLVRAPYTAAQGTRLGRAGRVSVTVDDAGQIWIGGRVITCVNGFFEL